MNNKIKLIVTDDASEFTQENLNILQSKNKGVTVWVQILLKVNFANP